MATYKIDSSLLTAQADEIRTLNGTTATMNPSQMTTALQSANAEVAAQEQKIIEIMGLLEGKSVPGGGGASIDTCSIRLINNDRSISGYSYLSYRDGQFVPVTYRNYPQYNNIDVTLTDVICGGYIYVQTRRLDAMTGIEIAGEATTEKTLILGTAYATVNIYAPSIAGSSSTVTITGDD